MLCQVRDDRSACHFFFFLCLYLFIFIIIVFFIFTPISLSAFVKPGPVLLQSSNAELHCDITGDPNTEVQWQRPPNGEEYKEKKQVIHLKSVTSEEAGQWTCLVEKKLKLIVTLTVVGWCLSVVVNQNELFFNYYYNVSHFMSVTFVWVSNRPPDHSC